MEINRSKLNPIKANYRPDIDGLRAVAVLAVILFHAGIPGFSGGFLGVDVFFVISGYLITQHLCEEVLQTGRVSFFGFYARRFRRLLPPLLLMVTVICAVWGIFFLGSSAKTGNLINSVSLSIVGLGNYFFMRNTGGYFDLDSHQMPMLHLWSLGVEEQFYFLWPALIAVLHLGKPRAPSFYRRAFTMTMILSGLSFLIATTRLIRHGATNTFYSTPSRVWELGAGALTGIGVLWIKQSIKKPPTDWLRPPVAAIALAVILLCVFFYNPQTHLPGPTALVPVFSAALIILTGAFKTEWRTDALAQKYLVRIGLVSYGWYLWHWPFLALERVWLLGETPPLSWRVTAVAISYLCAELSYKFVERPFRSRVVDKKISPPTLILEFLLAIAAMTYSLPGLVILEETKNSSNSALINNINARDELSTICDGHMESVLRGRCTMSFKSRKNQISPPAIGAHVIFWGNSHAEALFPMLQTFSSPVAFRATLMALGGTPGLLFPDEFYYESSAKSAVHQKFHRDALAEIKRLAANSPGKVSVFLISRLEQFTCRPHLTASHPELNCLDRNDSANDTFKILEKGLRETIEKLSQSGVTRIAILLPYPEFKYDISLCLYKSHASCEISRDRFYAYREPEVRLLRAVASDYSHVRLIDPVAAVCEKSDCKEFWNSAAYGPIPSVFDDSHPSVAAAKVLGRYFADDLNWLISGK